MAAQRNFHNQGEGKLRDNGRENCYERSIQYEIQSKESHTAKESKRSKKKAWRCQRLADV
jgi:hypothetical protein